jgi:hypothetical protein
MAKPLCPVDDGRLQQGGFAMMWSNDDLLTFELGPDKEQLYIHGDASGLRRLAKLLNELADAADRGELPEGRLRTDNWGGYGLTGETQEPYGECVNNVMIYGWTDRAGSKFSPTW